MDLVPLVSDRFVCHRILVHVKWLAFMSWKLWRCGHLTGGCACNWRVESCHWKVDGSVPFRLFDSSFDKKSVLGTFTEPRIVNFYLINVLLIRCIFLGLLTARPPSWLSMILGWWYSHPYSGYSCGVCCSSCKRILLSDTDSTFNQTMNSTYGHVGDGGWGGACYGESKTHSFR